MFVLGSDSMRWGRRCGTVLTGLAATWLCGCPLPDDNDAAERVPGKITVVFTNQSDALVNTLLSVEPDADTTLSWLVPVAPRSWDSLVLDCDIDQVTPVGTLVFNKLDGSDAVEVPFTEPPFEHGLDFGCGSVIAVQVKPSTSGSGTLLQARSANRTTLSAADSEMGPGPDSGLVLVQVEVPPGVQVRMNYTWESDDSLIFRSSITFGGRETASGFLLNCPVVRFALGGFDDDIPAATLTASGEELPAPPPLAFADGDCGGAIRMSLVASSQPPGYALTLQADPPPVTGNTMYDDVRDFLDAEDLFDRPSSLLSLLPPSVVTQE